MMETDLLVLGAGAGGLAAAVTAAIGGCKVIVAEKTNLLGGTMALSGGGIWIPCNPHMMAPDSKEQAAGYLRNILGNRFDEAMVDAFLTNGAEMVRYLEANTQSVRFFAADFLTDYEPSVPGANFGRTMSMPHFDADELGAAFDYLRPPLEQLTVLGGMQVDAGDLDPLIGRWKSWGAFRHTTRLVSRQTLDWLRSRKGRVLKSGNGVAARMIRAAQDKGVQFLRNAPALELIERDGRVVGAVLEVNGKRQEVLARRGVVIATGGFAQNAAMRETYMPFAAAHVSLLPDGNCGDGIGIATGIGAAMGDSVENAGCWTPVSVRQHADGSKTAYPHIFLDRSRPGSIMVDRLGKRFVNEATHYQALVSEIHRHGAVPCWLIASEGFLQRYGLGLVRPYESAAPYIADGYLLEGKSVAELAAVLGVPAAALQQTVDRVNRDAARGVDSEFGRGESVYDKTYGDQAHQPNPNFGPLGFGPYYAVRIVPGDLGTFAGLAVDPQARVLRNGTAVPGLYAVGLDARSMMGGTYPGAGSMLGPAFTFGYVAARHACSAPAPGTR